MSEFAELSEERQPSRPDVVATDVATSGLEWVIRRLERVPEDIVTRNTEHAQDIEAGLFAQKVSDGTFAVPEHIRRAYKQEGLSAAELDADIEEVARLGRVAFNDMVKENLGLVLSEVQRTKYRRRGFELGELVGEGVIGLIRAVEGFDYKRGLAFSTYAMGNMGRVGAAVERAIHDTGRAVRLPVGAELLRGQAVRAQRELREKLGRPVSDAEVAEELEWSEQKVTDVINAVIDPVSLDAPAFRDGDSPNHISYAELTPEATVQIERHAESSAMARVFAVINDRYISDEEFATGRAKHKGKVDQYRREVKRSRFTEYEVRLLELSFALDDGGPARNSGEVGKMVDMNKRTVENHLRATLSKLRRFLAEDDAAQAEPPLSI